MDVARCLCNSASVEINVVSRSDTWDLFGATSAYGYFSFDVCKSAQQDGLLFALMVLKLVSCYIPLVTHTESATEMPARIPSRGT